jgi:hypothetical protein
MAIQTTPSRLGLSQLNLGAGNDELFLKVFSGEIITSFEEANVMMPLHRVRTISSGKSAQFPVTGVATAGYHTPGESVLTAGDTAAFGAASSGAAAELSLGSAATGAAKYLSQFKHSEKVIYIDDVLLSSVFVADIDEMKNHYDVRSVYSKEIGRQLAYAADKNLIRTVIAAARETTDRYNVAAATSTQYLGERLEIDGGSAVDGAKLVEVLFTAAQKMDEKNVPMEGRYAVLPPAQYYALVNSGDTKIGINKDWGGSGSLAKHLGSQVEPCSDHRRIGGDEHPQQLADQERCLR